MNKHQKHSNRLTTANNELARYREKVGRMEAENRSLRKQLGVNQEGLKQLQESFCMASDALLAVLAIKFGKPVVDDEEKSSTFGQTIGHRLELDYYDAREIHRKYEVRAEFQDEKFVIGVSEREVDDQAKTAATMPEPSVENLPETCKDPVSADAEDAKDAE